MAEDKRPEELQNPDKAVEDLPDAEELEDEIIERREATSTDLTDSDEEE